jgi:predicted amino acid-binding ACT domain protein
MKCKIINSNKTTLEEKINEWLSTSNIEIFNVTQTQDDDYITIAIFYYDQSELRKLKLKKLNEY